MPPALPPRCALTQKIMVQPMCHELLWSIKYYYRRHTETYMIQNNQRGPAGSEILVV